jgi:hypothetical protein
MTSRWFARVFLVTILLVSRHAFAADVPQTMVRAHLEPSGPVVAGTEVRLVVDALTTTWFTAAPDWPLFTVPDAIVALPDEQAVNLSETIGGVRWFGVSRAYRIVPRAAKTFDIAPFELTVFPGGGADVPVKLKTPSLKLTATLPPGAEGMSSFFPLTKLTATQKIEPAQTRFKVGDTITRTITQTASGTESMLIPPVGFADIEGLRRYPKTPQTRNIVQDRAGLLAGERTDSTAYVVNRSGHYRLPPVTIEWWNEQTRNHRAAGGEPVGHAREGEAALRDSRRCDVEGREPYGDLHRRRAGRIWRRVDRGRVRTRLGLSAARASGRRGARAHP